MSALERHIEWLTRLWQGKAADGSTAVPVRSEVHPRSGSVCVCIGRLGDGSALHYIWYDKDGGELARGSQPREM